MRAFFVSVCMASLLIAQEPRTDKDHLQGIWEATAVESDGKAAGAETVKKFKMEVTGENLILTTATGGATKTVFQLDSTASPKTIDLTVKDNEAKGVIVQGIYAIDGDQLKLCIREVPERGSRPKEFKTGDNDAILFVTFKRAKK